MTNLPLCDVSRRDFASWLLQPSRWSEVRLCSATQDCLRRTKSSMECPRNFNMNLSQVIFQTISYLQWLRFHCSCNETIYRSMGVPSMLFVSKLNLNINNFVVHPKPLEVNHEIDLQRLSKLDPAGCRFQHVRQINALAVAAMSTRNILDPNIENLISFFRIYFFSNYVHYYFFWTDRF